MGVVLNTVVIFPEHTLRLHIPADLPAVVREGMEKGRLVSRCSRKGVLTRPPRFQASCRHFLEQRDSLAVRGDHIRVSLSVPGGHACRQSAVLRGGIGVAGVPCSGVGFRTLSSWWNGGDEATERR